MRKTGLIKLSRPEHVMFVYAFLGALTAIGIGLIESALPDWFSADRVFGLAAGLFIFVAGILLHLLRQLDHRNSTYDRRGRLMKALEDCALEEEIITNLCEAAGSFHAVPNTVWGNISIETAKSELMHATALLNDLAASRLALPNDGSLQLKRLIDDANYQIRATSILKIDENFWQSPNGKDYISVMAKAIEQKRSNGFSIRRLFIVEASLNQEMKNIIKHQRKIGIDVRVAEYEQISPSEREDMVIVDDEVLFKIGYTPGGEETPNSVISGQKSEIERHAALFERLWHKAELSN